MIKLAVIALALTTLPVAVPQAAARPLGEAQDRCLAYGFRDRNNQAACAETEMQYPAPKHWPLGDLMHAQNACMRFGYTGEGQAECIQRKLRSGPGDVPPPGRSGYDTSSTHYNGGRDRPDRGGHDHSQDVDPTPQFDKDGNPNFDTNGHYIGAHGAGARVDNPDTSSDATHSDDNGSGGDNANGDDGSTNEPS